LGQRIRSRNTPTATTRISVSVIRARMNHAARRRVVSVGWVMPKVLIKAVASASRTFIGKLMVRWPHKDQGIFV
jgi:hypothetical protein